MRSAVYKSKNKLISVLMCVVFVLTSFSFGMTAEAKSTSELREEQQKIQEEIDSAQSQIDSLAAEKAETQEYLNALETKIILLQDKIDALEDSKSALQSEIDSIQVKITKTEQDLVKAQEEIDKKQAEFDENYELYCKRLKAMYVSGKASNLEVLLTCEDMSAILTRSQMIKSVSEQDSKALDELMTKMEEIEAKKQEFEIKRNELNEDKDALEKSKQELQSQINEIDKSKTQLDSEAAECNALMKKLSSQQSEFMELIETNQEQIQAIENEIRSAAAGSSYGSGSGELSYPTDSRTVSAGYPNYSSGRYHGGIDFPVSSGSNVYAAADGTVILVKHLTYSYGYYVMIDHGDGLSTLYAHNSQILVSTGQQVSRGQVIAYSGSTGNSTGPHCHFEVRVNGSQVNPFNYL